MELISVGLAVVGIIGAITIPLWIEWLKRPRLSIERGEDLVGEPLPDTRAKTIVLKVINEPIEGRLGKFLLRNTANGCRVKVTILPLDKRPKEYGRVEWFFAMWSAKPPPIDYGTDSLDELKVPDSQVYDVPPTLEGADFPVVIKRNAEEVAYSFSPISYIQFPNTSLPGWTRVGHADTSLRLGHYSLLVVAEAGGVRCERKYKLEITGLSLDDIELEPWQDAAGPYGDEIKAIPWPDPDFKLIP